MNRKKTQTARRGYVLAMSLALLLILSMLGASLAQTSVAGARMSTRRRDQAAAFELAEAALNHGFKRQAENKNFSGQATTTFGSGQFQVNVVQPGVDWNQRSLTGIGRVTSVSGAIVESRVNALVDFESPVWDYSLITKLNLTLSGTVSTASSPLPAVGNVHSNGSITVSNNVVVDGRATSVGSATTGTATITGGSASGVAPVPFPQVDQTALIAEAQALGTTIGSVSMSSGTANLRGYLVGDLTLTSSARLVVDQVLYVTGNITLSGQAWLGDGTLAAGGRIILSGGSGFTGTETNNLAIISFSTSILSTAPAISVSGNSIIRGPIYCPNGLTDISGKPRIYGTVASSTVAMSGTPIFKRNTDLRAPWTLAGQPKIKYWQEL